MRSIVAAAILRQASAQEPWRNRSRMAAQTRRRARRSRFSPAAASGAWRPISTRSPGVHQHDLGLHRRQGRESDLRPGRRRGSTGHTEAVEIVFDPSKVSYQKLLDVFWRNHDPLAKDRQFCDSGNQYRAGDLLSRRRAAAARRGNQEDGAGEIRAARGAHRDHQGRRVLPGRGLSPGLLREKSGALQILPLQLRTRSAPGGAVGQTDKSS